MKTSTERVRCIVADRKLLLAQLLSHVMASHPNVVIEAIATSVRELDDLLGTRTVDVLLVGADLLEEDGIEILRRLNTLHPDASCIVLADESARSRLRSDQSGIVHAVLGMSQPFDALQRAMETLVGARCATADGDQPQLDGLKLTPRQEEVLKLIGSGKTSREIAEILGISWRTVETHRKHIVSRLRVKGGRLVRIAAWQALASESRRRRNPLYSGP
jgi:DNA-binding NarL/FixJ family response regulator